MSWFEDKKNQWQLRIRHFVSALWVRLTAALGLAAVAFIAVALLSYDPQDTSINTSSSGAISNWAGPLGAYIADFIMQLVGHAAWLVLLPLSARNIRQLRGIEASLPNWRFLAALFAPILMALALALSLRAASPDEPFPGGALGQLLADGLEVGISYGGLYLPRNGELALAALVALSAVLLALFASALTRQSGRGAIQAARLLAKGPRFAGNLARAVQVMKGFAKNLAPKAKSLDVAPDAADYAALDQAPAAAAAGQEAAYEPDDSSIIEPRIDTPSPAPKKGRRAAREAQPSLGFDKGAGFDLPPLRLLTEHKPLRPSQSLSKDALQANARMLESVLDDFGVKGQITNVRPGPVVTLYELEPAAGVRSSRVVGLADDIARSMSAVSARVAPVPGANVIGIELPNQTRELVSLRELLSSADFESGKSKLTMAVGKDIGGAPVMADLAKMPHLLVAGTTGSGKSVGINTMILSLLYRLTPDQCRLILVDPKMLELSVYDGIPHLLAPVVTEPKKAVVALKWVVQEMENRYRKMAKIGVRNIDGFNERMREAQKTGEKLTRRVQTGFDPETGEAIFEEEELAPEVLPFIVVVIDEMADLMMVAGKDIEAAVQRLAQMARAAGVHLITATQRPSVDVITGTIKANFPSRMSFQVTSKIDSRTVLGEMGAEQLLGQGDMLYMGNGARVQRVHGPFVSDEEVEKVVSFLKKQGVPEYIEQVTAEPEETPDMEVGSGDSLYDQAVAIVTRDGRASTSYVQRRLQIGYNRAARLIEEMEEQGVISPPNHAGKREILVGKH